MALDSESEHKVVVLEEIENSKPKEEHVSVSVNKEES